MSRNARRLGWWCVLGGLAAVSPVHAQTVDPAVQELLRQQERERVLREQHETRPDIRLEAPADGARARLPTDEAPCFTIERIVLVGDDAERFGWALGAADPPGDAATGRCLGTEGVNVTMTRVQNAIIARGYVTTRILAAPQDLTTGELALTVVPGRIRAVRFADGVQRPATTWRNAVPAGAGDLLNLRDIEQALENLQRVPTVSADIQMVPADGEAAQPGETDLAISWQQARGVRLGLTLDDAGSRGTGRLQGGATVSIDNAARWNDLFYVNLGRSLFNGDRRDTESWTAHYSVPFGYWLLGATTSGHDYRQTVAGAFESYVYSGSSRNAELKAARLLFRNARAKTSAYARGWWRESDNFIDDTEVEVQRRRMAGWEAGLSHRWFAGAATWDFGLGYRRGTGAFDALPAPEQAFGEGTARARVVTADAQLGLPFRWGGQSMRYLAVWRAQWNLTPLVPQDRFAIGGRYTVRGFDGEVSLTGERGWSLRNDIGLFVGGGQEAYLGLDYGRVGGPSTQWQLGQSLAGAVVGLRGGHGRLGWDVFVGAPVHQPSGFPAAYTTAGFSANWSY